MNIPNIKKKNVVHVSTYFLDVRQNAIDLYWYI